MDQFADEYTAGRTPNPCVLCNIWLKFGKLWAYGKEVGADFVATGHYARIAIAGDGTPRVCRAVDRAKDQSYVLFGLKRELLPHVLFPVGGYPKAEIRAIAKGQGLPVHDKPESQEICFVPERRLPRLRPRPTPPARRVRADRRRGRRRAGRARGDRRVHDRPEARAGDRRRAPRYVVQIEPSSNTVTVGRRESLERTGLVASRFNWQGHAPEGPSPCLAQIRARHQAVTSVVEPLGEGRVRVVFDVPQPAVTPGQVVTLYQDDLVLGGGWIDRALAPPPRGPEF